MGSDMKKLLLLAFACGITCSANEFPSLTLEADILEIVDDFPLGVNPDTVGMIMKLRRDLNKRRIGIKTTGGMEGFYTFEDKKWTLQMLVELEIQLLLTNSVNDQSRLAALYQLLQKIKEDFVELVDPFLADARGGKAQMIILITEWSVKANRQDTHLLHWANTKEGEETNAIYSKLITVKAFNQFVIDLLYFVETLLRSCPKACAHFKQIMEQKQSAKA
jgi:hypothetical protein